MSLEGSLETFALPEVLNLLSGTSKSGELRVHGARWAGRLWFDAGRLTGHEVGRCEDAVDALFDLLRIDAGEFSFETGVERPEGVHGHGFPGQDVREVLDVVQGRLGEWHAIVEVIPTLEHVVRLREEAPGEGVSLDPAQWSLVVAIGEGRAVQEVLDKKNLPEFDGCRSIKGLVDAALVSVVEAAPAEEPVAEEPVAEEPVAEEPVADFEAPTFEPVAEEPQVHEPVAEEPADEEPTFEEPVAEDPEVEEAVAEEPVAEEPTFGEPVAEAKEPEVDEPVAEVEEPGYEAAVADDPEVDEPGAEEPAPYVSPFEFAVLPSFEATQALAYDETEEADPQPTSFGAREALAAALGEVTAEEETDTEDTAADGLADRGPWTSSELASFEQVGGWHEDHEDHEDPVDHSANLASSLAAAAAAAAAAEGHQGVDGDETASENVEDEPVAPGEEPINRGLLLKFLSSVRS